MPRFGGAGGLSQLRQESARDSVEAEGLKRSTSWRLLNYSIGTLATSAALTLSAPLRNLHVRLLLDRLAPARHAASTSLSPSPSSSLEVVRGVWRRDGPGGFLQGNLSACARMGLYGALKMAFWTSFRLLLEDRTGRMSDYRQAVVAGVFSAAAAMVASLPLEVLELRMIAALHASDDSIERRRLREAPFGQRYLRLGQAEEPTLDSFYAGWKAALVGQLLQEAVLHAAQELLFLVESRPGVRRHLIRVDDWTRRVARDCLVWCVARAVCLPLVNVEYHMAITNKGFVECCRDIYAHGGGLAGFYTGLAAQLCAVVPFLCGYHIVMRAAHTALGCLTNVDAAGRDSIAPPEDNDEH